MPVGQLGSLNFANLVTCGHSYTVIAQPIAEFTEPTEVTVHVKDVWGYVTSQPLNMTLIKAE